MNLWMISAIILGILILGGIAVTALTTQDNGTDTSKTTTSCSSCGNSCNAEKNCGLATCGAVNGGSCGCNKAK